MADEADNDYWSTISKISQLVDTNQVSPEVLGHLDLAELIPAVNQLVSSQLGTLSDLSDDAEANEEALRATMQMTALKALLTGYHLREPEAGGDVEVVVAEETLDALAIGALRGGRLSFVLVAGSEEQ